MKKNTLLASILFLLLSAGAAKADDSNNAKAKFDSFTRGLSELPADSVQGAVKKLMRSAEQDREEYISLYNLATSAFFSTDSPMRDENCYIFFLQEVLNSGIPGEADRERAKFRMEMAMKNRPGTLAHDFAFITREGKESRLLESLQNKHTLLLFYDPDCGHCSDTIETLRHSPIPEWLSVVAIDPETDRALWECSKDALPEEWTIGFAIDPIQDDETYVFPEMPTLYLLDSKGTVILKEATVNQILNFK